MSPNMKISLLALVGAAAAAPHYSAHSRLHHKPSGGYAGPTAGWAGQNQTQPAPTGGASVVPFDDSTTTILETDYSTVTIKKTVYLTLSPSPVETPSAVAAADYSTGPAASGPAACGPATVTVTATNKVTVTVPAGGAPSSPAGNAPSSPAGGAPSHPVGGASSPAYTPPSTPEASSAVPQKPSSAPGYSASFVLASSSAVKVEQPSSEAPKSTPAATQEAYTSAAASSPVAVSSYVAPSSAKASSAAPSSSPSSSPSYSGGKRGLAYRWDGAADCKTFEGKNFGFAWNWEADTKGDIGSIPFIPTLRTLDNAGDWSTKVEAAISGGSKVAFGLNEPDIASQANLGVAAACSAWKQYMNPIKEKHSDVVLVGPFVSSSENAGQGLDYLSQFYKQCPDAQSDAAGIHWYGPSTAGFDAFKAHVDKAIQQTGKKVWITEFGLTGATAEESASFLKQAQEYLDNNDSCSGYSYYAVGSFDASANLLGTANSLSATGDVYVS